MKMNIHDHFRNDREIILKPPSRRIPLDKKYHEEKKFPVEWIAEISAIKTGRGEEWKV